MAENKINVGGRLHSIATGNVLAGANEIFDDEKNKKQNDINTETYSLVNNINERLNGLSPDQQSALNVATKATNNETKLGYYVCDTEGNVAAKVISDATGYVLSLGGSIKVKMTNVNTADNATLNINSTGAKSLYYDGERASANNTWKASETVEVYYDGTSYYANNVAGGSGSGDGAFDISDKTGQSYINLSAALTAADSILSTSKKKGGMSIKYVQSSDNKYVQYRFMLSKFTAAQFTNTANWQGVDDEPTAGSNNLVKSGGVYNAINPKYVAYASNQNVVRAVNELYLDSYADGLYIHTIVWTGTKLTLLIKDSTTNNVVFINKKDASVGEVFAFKSISGASIELKGYIVLSDTTVSISSIHANIEAAAYDLKYSTNILEYLTKPDNTPIEGSYKPVESGGMYDIIAEVNNTLNEKADYEDVGFEDWEDVSPIGEPLSSKYINYNGDLVDPSNSSFKVYSFPVTPGNTVKIHCALSVGSSYAYAFYSNNSYSSSTVVRVGPAVTAFVDPTTVIVPDNAAYILIQQYNGSDYGIQKKVINLIKDMIPEMVSDINNLKENTVECPLNVSRFDVGGTLPAGHRASWITINRRMDEEFDSVLNFCNKRSPNLTNKWFDFYSVGKHIRGVDGVSKCDNYTDWSTINGLSSSDALMMAVIVGAVNNIDGDNTTVKWHTGGAHAYGDSATGATPTMRELSNIVRVDGKSIAIGEKNIKGNKCTIDVINNVQGYNTCKEDGTGREIVQQRYHVEVTNDYCEVVTELVALEEVIVYGSNVVTGISMSNMQYRFIGSDSKRGLYTYNGSGNIPSNRDCKINTLRVEKDGYIFDVEYDLYYGLGNKLMSETYNLFVTNAAKAYFANIPTESNIHLNEGDSINWRVKLNIRKA